MLGFNYGAHLQNLLKVFDGIVDGALDAIKIQLLNPMAEPKRIIY